VCGDRVTTGEGESVSTAYIQSDAGEAALYV
jgi:hypothetical protein